MNLQKYEEALDNISDKIVPKYFNNDKQKYIEAKTLIMTVFKKDPREEILDSHPFFRPYFRKHFLYYCQNAPDFVSIVLSSISTETVSEVIDFIKDYPKLYYFTISRNKIAVAENSYQEIRKKIIDILDSPKISKNDINEVLNLTEPLSKVIYYWKGRFLYTYLFTELRFSLNLLSSIKEINKMSFPEKIVMTHYNNLLFELGNLKKREYSKYTFIQILIEDLEKIYKRIEEFHIKTKHQDQVSDSGLTSKPNMDVAITGLLEHIEDLSWDEITITLISLDSIRITTRDFKQTYHFSELDMKDRRSSEKADSNWILLSLFAKKNGTVTYTDIDSTGKYSSPKKAIATLQSKLKQLFDLKDNPIEKYKSRVGYIAKFYIKHEIPSQFHGSVQQSDAIEELKW